MADQQKLREQIAACRPDSDDLQLPELRELARAIEAVAPQVADVALAQQLARSQQFDRAVRGAVQDVPVPAGLLEQLLASAGQVSSQVSSAEQASLANAAVELPAADFARDELQPRPMQPSRVKRARFLAILTTIAAVVVLALSIRAYLPTPQKVVTAGELSERVDRWLVEVLPPAGWNRDLNQAPLKTHPLATSIRVKPLRWHALATADDSRAVVYDLTRPGRQRAVLFVLQSPAKYSVAAPPASTQLLASRGMRVVAWQAGEHLYVLAVQEGDGQHLDDFLRRTRITRHWPPASPPAAGFDPALVALAAN